VNEHVRSAQSQTVRGRVKEGIRPIDLGEALNQLKLGIGPAARMCGVSIRQLSYWTDKGIFNREEECLEGTTRSSSKESSRSRLYDFPSLEKACLIKQGLDLGYSLEAAVAEANVFLKKRNEEQQRLKHLSEGDLMIRVQEQADALMGLAERIRRGLRTYRVSGDLGRMAASSRGLERLISFFEANPFTVNTARQIALRMGRDVEEVTKELHILEEKRFIQRISYPGNDIYRYLPRRR
jgi:DNA-binding transcriptional MerR regulator